MLILLCTTVFLSIVISAFSSVTEAALYAVPLTYVQHLADSGTRSGKLLLKFKENINKPITAILIFNTVSNTAGAAIAGWAAGAIFGSEALILFSVIFTLLILYFSEIIPKMAGVIFCKPISQVIIYPLYVMVFLCAPLIWISERLTKKITVKAKKEGMSIEELLSMTALGTEQGTLDRFEGSVINNVIGLDGLLVKDVLTPRIVVFRLSKDQKIKDLSAEIIDWHFSRVPLYDEDEPDNLTHYVIQRDIYREIIKGDKEKSLVSLARPLKIVPELMTVDKLLLDMFEEKEHICSVVDEHGGLAGIITLF